MRGAAIPPIMTSARTLLILSSLFLMASCRREVTEDPSVEAMRKHREEMKAMRAELKDSQELIRGQQLAWEEERDAMRDQLDAVGKEQEQVEEDQVFREGAIDEWSGEIEQREEVLAQWEQQLGLN